MTELQDLVSKRSLGDCRRVFIQRDYTKGLNVRFTTELPGLVGERCEKEVWVDFINTINEKFETAAKVNIASALETCFNCLTCYLFSLCVKSSYNKAIDGIIDFIEVKNKSIFQDRNLFITNPMKKGLRVIEVVILNEFDAPSAPVLNAPVSLVPR
uniref:Erf4 domain-containing protein n=1 Tax=Rhabditophanes sp. KR3021 TaxID=114890 RepID=A0AC35TX25_9BILA